MNRTLAIIGAAVLSFSLSAHSHSQGRPRAGGLIDIGRLKLHYYTQGNGSPTIIVDVGNGSGADL